DPAKAERWTATVVTDADGGGLELRSARGAVPIGTPGRAYQWDRGFVWGEDNRIVVPTDHGIAVFSFDAKGNPIEQYQPLVNESAPPGRESPQIQLDGPGLLCWVPASETGLVRGQMIARYVDGRFEPLDPRDWPTTAIHLAPLRDLSVLQILADGGGRVRLATAQLAGPAVDEPRVTQLVEELSDEDDAKRDAAYRELTLYGPGIWPILEKLLPDQSPEAQLRVETLLRDRTAPTLGGMTLVDGRLRVVSRLADRGAVFYAPAGVRLAAPPGKPQPIVSPAWLTVRPGEAITLLPPTLVSDLNPDRVRISAVEHEWVVSDPARGPRRFIGNALHPIVPPPLRTFDQLVAIDRRGRWVLAESSSPGGKRLILDPTLPDPTPRLPAWDMLVNKGKVGWTADDWPVIVTEGKAWKLKERAWVPVDEQKEKVLTSRPPSPPPPTTAGVDGPPLLTDADGTSYHGGRTELITVTKAGRRTVWPLPPAALGSRDAWLVKVPGGRLFLFNAPGRVVRIKPTPNEPEPFTVDGTFTRNVPSAGEFVRVWTDPAGRICAMSADDRMHVLFPEGLIPTPIARMMPADAIEANRE
ncbi:MAG TPA: hypothetical protein VK324_13790, partial [Tepidisphaeraceae bacterium]|nr:hypothetical protein [Tepidisphaeraceae bacterium]